MKVRFPFTALGMSIMLISTLTVNSQSTRENLGLYGGTVLSYAYDEVNDKVFAAVAGPLSLFTSSDSCKTWEQSFPDDSLNTIPIQFTSLSETVSCSWILQNRPIPTVLLTQ